MSTKIAWADEVWNPVTGCSKVSAGCTHCYAESLTRRFGGDFSQIILHPDRLTKPLHWKKPRRVFVNSMSDLFHKDVPDEFIDNVYETMLEASQHTYLLLTKRPKRMRNCVRRWLGYNSLLGGILTEKMLENIWLGVSIEDQANADERIPWLFKTPAMVRWASVEPILDKVSFRWAKWVDYTRAPGKAVNHLDGMRGLDWVVVGGESGSHRRPCEVSWIADIVGQCKAAAVPCYVKQDSHLLPGQQGRIPDDLWAVKEYPQ